MTAQCLICCAEFENRTSKRYCSKKCKQQARNIVRNPHPLKKSGRKPLICPHDIVGIENCQQCVAARTRIGARNRREADPNKREQEREKCARWRAKNREKTRAYSREKRGIPVLGGESKNGGCPFCERIRQLVPDHDHDTGLLRGWICGTCNRMMGIYETLKKDGRLLKMQSYLGEIANV